MISVNTVMARSQSEPSQRGEAVYRFHSCRKKAKKNSGTFNGFPSRSDVEPKPARLFRGYKRYVVHPEEYKGHDEVVKLYSQILKTR